MVKSIIKRIQSNNRGFSLLEVLIAMIILAIVCVPLLRAFGTSAQTNAKAKIKMKAVTAAENIMENIKMLDTPGLEALISNYEDNSNDNRVDYIDEMDDETNSKVISKAIKLTIKDNAEMNADLPDGYYAEVLLEARGNASDANDRAYPNANSLNLSSFKPISGTDCAIYTMEKDFDAKAYDEFLRRNEKFKLANAAANDFENNADNVKGLLKRTINLYIKKVGTYTDSDGEEQPAIEVTISFLYELPELNYVSTNERSYVPFTSDVLLFDNKSDNQPLNGIYLFYYPRFSAANNHYAGQGYEKINIFNNDNIKTNIYVTALNNGAEYSETNMGTYYNNKSCQINVIETSAGEKSSLTLRTNLLKTSSVTKLRTPYSKGDNNTDYGLAFNWSYTGGSLSDDAAFIKKLTVSDVDGKTLDTSDTPIRIYRLRVKIYDNAGNVITEMDGTKLKQD